MSPNDDNPQEVKKARKKYLWLGYGNYGSFGAENAVGPQDLRAGPTLFERLFEIFGVKEKSEEKRPSCAYGFTNDVDTGMYLGGAGDLGIVAAGNRAIRVRGDITFELNTVLGNNLYHYFGNASQCAIQLQHHADPRHADDRRGFDHG